MFPATSKQKPYRITPCLFPNASRRNTKKRKENRINHFITARFLRRSAGKEIIVSHSSTLSFLSYWRALQQGAAQNSTQKLSTRRDETEISRAAPLRADFDPVQLKDLMPQMMMIATAGNDYRFRLTGGFLVALHGAGLKTTPFTKLFAPAHEEQLKVALNLAAHRQQPLILTASATTSGNETVRLDIAIAPLRNASGEVDRLVGLYQPKGPIPFLRRATVTAMTLHTVRLYDPERLPRESHLRLVSVKGQLIA
jgi:hypothetical protein